MAHIQFNEHMIGHTATVELAQAVVRRLKPHWSIEYYAGTDAQWIFKDADELFCFEQDLKDICAQLQAPYEWQLTLLGEAYHGRASMSNEWIYQ